MTRDILFRTLAGTCALALFAAPAGAQSTDWEFALSPYAWVPGVSTSTETGRGRIDVDTSASEALADLDFALMGAFEARKGRWGLILDLLYADLSASESTPLGILWSDAKVETRLTAFTVYAGYRVVENDRASLDLLGGARSYWLDLDLSLEPGRLEGRSRSLSENWADPVFGLRGRYAFNDKWFATALVDAGGFAGGSDQSWQGFASVGYQFDERWSIQGGWRYMSIEKDVDGQDVEVGLNGPILGFTARF